MATGDNQAIIASYLNAQSQAQASQLYNQGLVNVANGGLNYGLGSGLSNSPPTHTHNFVATASSPIGGATIGVATAGLPAGSYQSGLGSQGFTIPLYSRTGAVVQVVLMDANGISHIITIDQAHLNLISAINNANSFSHTNVHGHTHAYSPAPVQIMKMNDDMFSLEEIAEGEKIMEELGA